VRATQRLQRLRERRPKSAAEIDSYYVEASAILREYIGERFALRAPEMTTEEFLNAPQTARALHASHRDLLSEFLTHCDMVKFACHMPTASDRERLLEAATIFLEETRNDDTREPATAVSPEGSGAA
jgi:hypothetical protein